MSGAENDRQSSVHSMGPKDVSASPSRSTSSASTLNASSGAGHPPVSLVFVATNTVALSPGTTKCPSIDDTLQTGKPSPMSSPTGSPIDGEGVGAGVGAGGEGTAPSVRVCQAGSPMAPATAAGSPPLAAIVLPSGDHVGPPYNMLSVPGIRRVCPVAISRTSMPSEPANATCSPSGDHAGSETIPGSIVMRVGDPPSID